jgi:hypothetical protein
MEIDFNPSQIPKPELRQPIVRKSASSPASESAGTGSAPTAADLRSQLNQISLVRPEKVDQAKALVSATSYPPVELLDRIAVLLAVHLRD